MFDFLKKHRRALQIVGGIALVVVGVLMATGLWAAMMSWLQASSPGYELPV